MAEIGVAASLIQIAGSAIQLTRTLYEFGSTTSAAREQVDYIGKNVSYYSDVLELLVEQFEHDRPIHSRKAIALAEKLYDHSYGLFERIRDLIPVATAPEIRYLFSRGLLGISRRRESLSLWVS
jgi:hypothetical protein